MKYDMFVCGILPLVEGTPCHDMFMCDPDLSCISPVEADFYNGKRTLMAAKDYVRDPSICAICAGTSRSKGGGKVDPALKTMY